MGDLARQAAKDRIKPTFDVNLAREAIGVTPEQLGTASSAPAGAKKAPAS